MVDLSLFFSKTCGLYEMQNYNLLADTLDANVKSLLDYSAFNEASKIEQTLINK